MSLMTSPSSPLRLALCVTLGLLLGAGCYNPTFTDGQFRCASDSECPDGQVCRPLGDGLRCLWPSSDLGASDSACAGKGMALATGVWACTGDFVAGQGASLCRGAYEPCAQKHAAALGRLFAGNHCEPTNVERGGPWRAAAAAAPFNRRSITEALLRCLIKC